MGFVIRLCAAALAFCASAYAMAPLQQGAPPLRQDKGWSLWHFCANYAECMGPSPMEGSSAEARLHRSMYQMGITPLEIIPIAGGCTNQGFRINTEERSYFARVIGADTELVGVDRQAELAILPLAAEARLCPELVGFIPEEGVMFFEFLQGKTFPMDGMKSPFLLKQTARLMRTCHQLDVELPKQLDPFEEIERFYREAVARQAVLHDSIPFAMSHLKKLQQVLSFQADLVPCHLDVHGGNILWSGSDFWLIDWEFAGMSDPYLDLSLFAATSTLSNRQMDQLLSYYLERRPQEAELYRLRLYRAVADLYWSMWCTLQTVTSDLDVDFQQMASTFYQSYMNRLSTPSYHRGLLLAHNSARGNPQDMRIAWG